MAADMAWLRTGCPDHPAQHGYLTINLFQCDLEALLIQGPDMASPTPRFAYKGDRLKPLRAFCRVLRLGSVPRAAEPLILTQPAVTQQLKARGHVSRTPLLERSARRPVSTQEGEAAAE